MDAPLNTTTQKLLLYSTLLLFTLLLMSKPMFYKLNLKEFKLPYHASLVIHVKERDSPNPLPYFPLILNSQPIIFNIIIYYQIRRRCLLFDTGTCIILFLWKSAPKHSD